MCQKRTKQSRHCWLEVSTASAIRHSTWCNIFVVSTAVRLFYICFCSIYGELQRKLWQFENTKGKLHKKYSSPLGHRRWCWIAGGLFRYFEFDGGMTASLSSFSIPQWMQNHRLQCIRHLNIYNDFWFHFFFRFVSWKMKKTHQNFQTMNEYIKIF